MKLVQKKIHNTIQVAILETIYYKLITIVTHAKIPSNYKGLETITAINIHDKIEEGVKNQIQIIAPIINKYRSLKQ